MKALLVTLSALAATTLAASADNLVLKGSDTLGAKLVPQLGSSSNPITPALPLISRPKAQRQDSPP